MGSMRAARNAGIDAATMQATMMRRMLVLTNNRS